MDPTATSSGTPSNLGPLEAPHGLSLQTGRQVEGQFLELVEQCVVTGERPELCPALSPYHRCL